MQTGENMGRDLSRQLHQTTQPLSVLQGILELALIQAKTADDYKRSVGQALDELERVCECFEDLRRLIHTFRSVDTVDPKPEVNRV